MKRIIALTLAVLMIAATFVGCANKRELFNLNLEKYVGLPDYKNITVEKSSDEYKNYYNMTFENYVYNANAYSQVKTGTVANGDVLNIDYVGKIDGKEFEGGSAKGYFLTIGSNTFIDGFESGLVGKEIGKTVDINVTFPTNYDSSVAGKAAVFTVTINYRQELPEIDDAIAVKLGFKTSDELKENLDAAATDNYIFAKVTGSSTISEYTKKDKAKFDEFYEKHINELTSAATSAGYDLETYIQGYYGVTSAQYKSNYYKQQLEPAMVFYAIFDKEKLEFTDEDIEATINDLAKGSGATVAQIRENYEDWQIEFITVQGIVLEYLNTVVTVK